MALPKLAATRIKILLECGQGSRLVSSVLRLGNTKGAGLDLNQTFNWESWAILDIEHIRLNPAIQRFACSRSSLNLQQSNFFCHEVEWTGLKYKSFFMHQQQERKCNFRCRCCRCSCWRRCRRCCRCRCWRRCSRVGWKVLEGNDSFCLEPIFKLKSCFYETVLDARVIKGSFSIVVLMDQHVFCVWIKYRCPSRNL